MPNGADGYPDVQEDPCQLSCWATCPSPRARPPWTPRSPRPSSERPTWWSSTPTAATTATRGADDSKAELDDVRARVEAAGVVFDVRHPETGLEPAEDLLAIAEEVGAELIVIGLRRRTPVGKLILGSNAQRILLDAHCPVLAVKSD